MIGKTISHYKILSKLGEGGMGVVYKAEDLTLGRTVALKFLPPDSIATENDRARLVHEARAAAALLHPNICPVYEITDADGRTFIAMAYIEGRSLRDRLAEGSLSIDEALAIARQVGEALATAHAKGIVHRDVKPANIMLTVDSQAVLMDFGLAKVSGATRLTKTGMTLGTVRYMSPEQARGEEVDQRSDVWSLGAVLYEMLAGQPAFPGLHEQAVIYGILHEDPTPISIHRPDVPGGVASVLERALRKDPRERYASVRELLADLESAEQGSSTQRLGVKRPGLGFLNRHRRAAALLLLFAIVGAGAWLLLRPGRPLRSEDLALAVMDFEDLGGSADTLSAAGLNGLLQVGLIEQSPIRVVSPEYLQELHRRLFSGVQGAIRPDQALEIARKAGASLLLSGQIGHEQGSTFAIWRLLETERGRSVGGRRVADSELLGLADGIIAEVVPLIVQRARVKPPVAVGSVDQVTSASPEAYRHFVAAEVAGNDGKMDEELRQLQIAVQLDSTFALAWLRMADVYWYRTQFVPGRKFADKAWELRTRLGIKDRMMLESRRLQLDRRITAGLDVYREMMSRWPDDRTIVQSYATALYWWWYDREAQVAAEQGIEHYPDDEDLRSTRESALLAQDNAAEALASARAYQRRDPGDAFGWARVGECHLAAGDIDSAEVAFRRARNLAPDDFELQHDLARCAFLRGDPMGAAAILERLLTRTDLSVGQKKILLTGGPGGPWWLYKPGLVDCYAETGRLNRALELMDEWGRGVNSADAETQVLVQMARCLKLLEYGRPQPVLTSAHELSQRRDIDWAQNLGRLFRTAALVELDSLSAAREGLVQLRAMKDRYGVFVRWAPLSIAARIALAEGQPDSALARLQELKHAATRWEWDTRVRALRALKRLPEAATTLEELLHRNGSRFIARYQLGQIYEEMGRKAEAAREYKIFLKAWENADPGWPQVEDARKRLAALRGTAKN
jgi:tetratricopeptide (TPR) repeat protein/predicted Ser/Thr protein kinase